MSEKAPLVHSVHFYENQSSLIERLCGIVLSGLRTGNSVLVVATSAHRLELVKALKDAGVDIRSVARDGRFTMFDAKETLDTFMVDGLPNAKQFDKSLGKVLKEAKKKALGIDQRLTVFGEMVAVLWDDGNQEGALALEKLWNDALNEGSFHLHCAYPRAAFRTEGRDAGMESICHSHSHVLVA